MKSFFFFFFFLDFCLTTVFEPNLRSVLFLGGECWFSSWLSFQGLAWVNKNLKSTDAWCREIAPWNSPAHVLLLWYQIPLPSATNGQLVSISQIALCSIFLFIFSQFNIKHMKGFFTIWSNNWFFLWKKKKVKNIWGWTTV